MKIPDSINLNGNWEFSYESDDSNFKVSTLFKGNYEATMPVPGIWDNNLDKLDKYWRETVYNPTRPIKFPLKERSPDTPAAFLLGVGWYRKRFRVPAEWKNKTVVLQVGGIMKEAKIWLNGKFIGGPFEFDIPFEIPLKVTPEKVNELVIAVSNQNGDRQGCSIRSHGGRSGGFYRLVTLRVTGSLRIKDLFVFPERKKNKLNWNIEFDQLDKSPAKLTFEWAVKNKNGKIIANGKSAKTTWATPIPELRKWSDNDPNLYVVEVKLYRNNIFQDTISRTFGLRTIKRVKNRLVLNGKTIYLRGICEHHYFPLTRIAPADIGVYRQRIRILKQLGFNWLRFHTWVPNEEFMRAADELGMLIQIEPAGGFNEKVWTQIIRYCRRHPSVIIYCTGNEQRIDDKKLKFLQKLSSLVREHAPDALYNPMSCLHGIEYYGDKSVLGKPEEIVDKPVPHNPRRWRIIREISDVLCNHVWSRLSYHCAEKSWGDHRFIDDFLKLCKRPSLAHEICINGSFYDFSLRERYPENSLGAKMYDALRQHLNEEGLLDKAPIYYQASCRLVHRLRKHTFERARRSRLLSGYDFLSAADTHWHRTGYPCGIMNEFYELKPGDSVENILRHNGESVLLLDHEFDWNFRSGDKINFKVMVSLFGDKPIEKGVLSWSLNDQNKCYQRGNANCKKIPNGDLSNIGEIKLIAPKFDFPQKLTLKIQLADINYEIDNQWNLWVFPLEKNSSDTNSEKVKIVNKLDKKNLSAIENGAKIILFGHEPFASASTIFMSPPAGRPLGHRGMVINEHPLFDRFPHEGFADWQFFSMLEEGHIIYWEESGLMDVKPIIEAIPAPKNIRKASPLFECRIGKGSLLVCSLKIDPKDPATAYLVEQIKQYAASNKFKPETKVKTATIAKLLFKPAKTEGLQKTDEVLDPNVVKT